MKKVDLVINGYNLGSVTVSDLAEENEHIFAPRCLQDAYMWDFPTSFVLHLGYTTRMTRMDRVMSLLPHVGDLFNIDKDVLLERWVTHYAIDDLIES